MTEFYGTFEGELDGIANKDVIQTRLENALPEGVDVTGLQIRDNG